MIRDVKVMSVYADGYMICAANSLKKQNIILISRSELNYDQIVIESLRAFAHIIPLSFLSRSSLLCVTNCSYVFISS